MDCNAFKKSGAIHKMTQCNIPEEMDIEQHCCENHVETFHI